MSENRISRRIISLLISATECSSSDETRPYLQSAHIRPDEKGELGDYIIEGINGYCAIKYEVTDLDLKITEGLILSAVDLQRIKPYLNENKRITKFDLTIEEENIVIEYNYHKFSIRKITNKEYPKTDTVYERDMQGPDEDFLEVSFNPSLLEAVSRAFGCNKNTGLILRIKKGNPHAVIKVTSKIHKETVGAIMPMKI